MASSGPPRLSKVHKQRLIQRFKRETARREQLLRQAGGRQAEEISLKVKNRLNKILRKFWDIKIRDILEVEREMPLDQLTLLKVLRQLEIPSSASAV
ncbi:hypothetical protein KL930_003109 [Ogataea haglerorum]|uniref:Borealin N-terminal domain-containing protein n=1 Tax=Ogataea haglerorum TaxID=1937702 RepID=A0ABQ7RHN0_9ASCO|nr:uncharacterized protein KL911_002637 [Ogataea haglerorum]KAG7696083.1 hypothetical protein KL915_002447 [Ogataea haglerorum]KAG7696454.1 hypothetical protein KL951_002910 [Ogataea haglerorum]KAG7707101.1 hypothetical protein KL914_002985 [Ogataea haglerorum]KAG7708591.1 hypothetical protein KL950_002111 [Ogataea haglerorum]KAG7713761.1 hypothetical protein KL913_004785 [Ogataea haglerorum]